MFLQINFLSIESNDEAEKILTQKEDVVKRWAEYCEELYVDDHKQDPQLLQDSRQHR